MLITNADDWGRSVPETDVALRCFEAGTVTSVSAMVFMKDSHRAAALARQAGIDVGLHLNLTQPFTQEGVPPCLSQAQGRIARFLRRSKYALIIYQPMLQADFRLVYNFQSSEFMRLYAKTPSHVDGHQHMHLSTNILLGRVLPKGAKVRRSFSFWPGEKSAPNRCYRWVVDYCLSRRHRITDYFFSLGQSLLSGRMPRIAELAKSSNVELMTHPVRPQELEFLLGNQWSRRIAELKVGSYEQL